MLFVTAEDAYGINSNMHLDSAVGAHLDYGNTHEYKKLILLEVIGFAAKTGLGVPEGSGRKQVGSCFGRRLNGRRRGACSGSDYCCLWLH